MKEYKLFVFGLSDRPKPFNYMELEPKINKIAKDGYKIENMAFKDNECVVLTSIEDEPFIGDKN